MSFLCYDNDSMEEISCIFWFLSIAWNHKGWSDGVIAVSLEAHVDRAKRH